MRSSLEKEQIKYNRPAGIIVLTIYLIFQGLSLISLTSQFGDIIFIISAVMIACGIGLLYGKVMAYVVTVVVFSGAIITAIFHYLLYETYYFSLGSIIGAIFWSTLILVYLIMPGVRRFYFKKEDQINKSVLKKSGAIIKTEQESIYPKSKNNDQYSEVKLNEQPVFVWPTGTKYYGEYEGGKRQGWGETHYLNGTRYVGHYKNDRRHGEGTMIYPDGRRQKGIWIMDKLQTPPS